MAIGTHVAGTIAALGGNGKGVVGVVGNGNLNLHIVRVFGDNGFWAWTSTLIAAVSLINLCLLRSTAIDFSSS